MIVKRKMMVVAVLAFVTAASGTGLWLYSEQLDDEFESLVSDQVEVVKAAVPVRRGDVLMKAQITTEKVPRKFLPPDPLLESELNIYLGTPLAATVQAGAMILTSDFFEEKSNDFGSPLVIKSARMTLESEDPIASGQEALAIVAAHGGYVVTSELVSRSRQGTKRFNMVARVPAVEFEGALVEARGLGAPIDQRITGSGVTEDVRELEEKLGINQDLEADLVDLAKERASSGRPDIEIIRGDAAGAVVRSATAAEVEAAREIAKVREASSQLRSESAKIRAQVAMATIEIEIVLPSLSNVEPPGAWDRTELAFAKAFQQMLLTTFFLMRCLASLLPFLLFASPFLVGGLIWHRRRRRDA